MMQNDQSDAYRRLAVERDLAISSGRPLTNEDLADLYVRYWADQVGRSTSFQTDAEVTGSPTLKPD